MRRFRIIVVTLLALGLSLSMLSPSIAFAESSGGGDIDSDPGLLEPPWNTVIYGPNRSTDFGTDGDLGGTVRVEVGICAASRYDAAMVALGYDGAYINQLSSDVKARLSNSSTGGDFWTFAQKFNNPTNDAYDLVQLYWMGFNFLYGTGSVWRGTYTDYDANLAKDALQTILNGGGGGGGSSDGDYVYIDCVRTGYTLSIYENVSGVALQKNYADSIAMTISDNPDAGLKLWISFGGFANEVNYGYVTVNVASEQPTIRGDYSYYWTVGATYFSAGYPNGGFSELRVGNYVTHNGKTYALCPLAMDSVRSFDVRVNNSSIQVGQRPVYSYYYGDVGGTVDTPPSNWPEQPSVQAPTAPDVPEPSQPESPSQPVMPTAPDLPDFPSNIISPGSSYDTYDIQAILDAMDEHCQHLQSAVYQGFSDYFDTFTPWLRDEFATLRTFLREEDDWIVESISDEFFELRSYLKELAEWLAEQMDFTITGGDFNDSTIVSWLKRIYFKLGGSPVSTKPVDPVGDPDGSWDWLNKLIEGILSALASGAAALTGTLGELFEGIKDKFPFSIPWDIVAIVALLDAPPVTPAAVIEYDVFGAHVRYDIDLHFFDEQASVIRAMEDVLFCAFLLFKTDWLTGIFDGIGGFLGGKLKSTVKGV